MSKEDFVRAFDWAIEEQDRRRVLKRKRQLNTMIALAYYALGILTPIIVLLVLLARRPLEWETRK